MRKFHLFVQTAICLLCLSMVLPAKAQPQVVLEDQFNSSTFDTDKWAFYGDSSIGGNGVGNVITGRTNFNFAPYISTEPGATFLRLKMDTYNPQNPGGTYKGTEMWSRTGFGPPGVTPSNKVTSVDASSTGFEFETKMRYTRPESFDGWAAFWTYWNHGTSFVASDPNYSAEEIDIEEHTSISPVAHNKYDLRNYHNWNASQPNAYSNSSIIYSPDPNSSSNYTGPDYTQWHHLKIVWTPVSGSTWLTRWYVKKNAGDSYRLMDKNSTVSPNKWMTVRFNKWAGGDGPPRVSTPSANQSYFLDVDWVKVSKVSASSAFITYVNGTSSPNGRTFNKINAIRGSVNDSANVVGKISVVITRLSDNLKWKGYDDASGPHGWVSGDQLVAAPSDYPNTKPTWNSDYIMPTAAETPNGEYLIVADALTTNNGYLFSSDSVKINVATSSNVAPQTVNVTPSSGSSVVGTARQLSPKYYDANGSSDLLTLGLGIKTQGGSNTSAYYNRYDRRLWLRSDDDTQWIGGFPIGSSNTISNKYVSVNCATTTVGEDPNYAVVNWSLTPTSLLIGTNTLFLSCSDQSQVSSTTDQRGTWTVTSSGGV